MSIHHPWAKGRKHSKLAPKCPYQFGYNARSEKRSLAEEFNALYAATSPKQVRVNKRTEKRAIAYAESGSPKDFARLPRAARRLVTRFVADACIDSERFWA